VVLQSQAMIAHRGAAMAACSAYPKGADTPALRAMA